MGTLSIKGESTGGSQTLDIMAWDGDDWGASTNIVVVTNSKPNINSISGIRIKINEKKNISGFINATDINNDVVTKYRIRDKTGNNNFYLNNNIVQAREGNGFEFPSSQLYTLQIDGEDKGGVSILEL